MAKSYIYAKDYPAEDGLLIRKLYERKDPKTKRPGRVHVVLRFPRQELIDEATEHLKTWLETKGVWVIVMKRNGGQNGQE